MDITTEMKKEEMKVSAGMVQSATAEKKAAAELIMAGFFAGIQSREAMPEDKTRPA